MKIKSNFNKAILSKGVLLETEKIIYFLYKKISKKWLQIHKTDSKKDDLKKLYELIISYSYFMPFMPFIPVIPVIAAIPP